MAGDPVKITDLSTSSANLVPGDWLEIVDVSDTTMAGTGTNLKRAVNTFSLPETTQTGTTYTVDSDDDLTVVVCSNASQVTVTLPTDASDDLRDGYCVVLLSTGAGGVTLSTTGLTLLGSSPNTTIAQNEIMICQKSTTANTWAVIGGTAA